MDAVVCNMALVDIPGLTATFSSVRHETVAGIRAVNTEMQRRQKQ